MLKKIFKQMYIALSVLVVIGSLTPHSVLAGESDESIDPPVAVVDIERFSIGQGFYQEPTFVAIKDGDTAYDLLVNMVGNKNIIRADSSLKAIKGADKGHESILIPNYIVKQLNGPDSKAAKIYGNGLKDQALGRTSYSDKAKWICVVNNKRLDKKMSDYQVKDKDVIRFAFSYWGDGADVTGYSQKSLHPLIKMGDKDELLAAMAFLKVDAYKYLFNSPLIASVYEEAVALVQDALATQKKIDAVAENLMTAAGNYSIVSQYKTHIQNKGWEKDWIIDNEMSGTSGQSLRLEAINIEMQNNKDYDVGVEYRTHIENKGWEKNWKKDGDLSGTQGQSLRLEAIEIKLTGADADLFDVYYQVHAQNVGWMALAKNGGPAGTAGFAYRLEGIRIQVVPKDLQPRQLSNSDVGNSFMEK